MHYIHNSKIVLQYNYLVYNHGQYVSDDGVLQSILNNIITMKQAFIPIEQKLNFIAITNENLPTKADDTIKNDFP